jgi:hypothetical protein
MIMSSRTSSILLNRVTGKVFHYKRERGVRHGDPLSPLPFVLAADLLQSIVNSALSRGFFRLPLVRGGGTDFLIIQYVDDTLLVMEACPRQLLALKSILNTFAASTGLRVNFQKSIIYLVNVEHEEMEILAQTFGCEIGGFPFTYLGLPLGPNKPSVEDWLPLVQRIERRLVSTSQFLNQAGRLEMVNSVLSTLPTFCVIVINLPPTIKKMIDKYKKHCMWRGSDLNAKKPLWQLGTWQQDQKRKEV